MKATGHVIRVIGLISALVTCACKEEVPPAPPITYQPAPEVGEPERVPTAAEVPVPADFDDESEAEITKDNVGAELDRLEAEINADTAP